MTKLGLVLMIVVPIIITVFVVIGITQKGRTKPQD